MTYKRLRNRDCNTGNLTQCRTEPGVEQISDEYQDCVYWLSWSVWTTFKLLNSEAECAICFSKGSANLRDINFLKKTHLIKFLDSSN